MEPPGTSGVEDLIRSFAHVRGGLLPALQAVQAQQGYIDRSLFPVFADVHNVSVAEVHGTVSFYDDLTTEPAGAPVVRACRGEACVARGSSLLRSSIERECERRGALLHDVSCVGNCALGPNVMVGDRVRPIADHALVGSVIGELLAARPSSPTAMAAAVTVDHGPTVFVPRDLAALGQGADEVATALAAHGCRVVRTGSRGALWLEPLVEIDVDGRRHGYGPIDVDDVPGLVGAMRSGTEHVRSLGPVESLPFLMAQHRSTFARSGIVDPSDVADHEHHGGLRALRVALRTAPHDLVAAVSESGLRGRGGAAFPTGIKMRTVLDTPSPQKFVVVNADEGDAGAFADRMVMEGDPFLLLEGVAIAALAVGADEAFVYIRSEYPDAVRTMREAVAAAERAGWLGADVLGSGRTVQVHVRMGAGSYICGEETALLASLEGGRGVVRAKPPVPAVSGLWDCPTLVANVLTVAALPAIVDGGPAAHAGLGSGRSRGTLVVQLGGDVARGGIVEVPFGTSLRHVVEDLGGGTRSGRPLRAVQVGGPLGAFLPAAALDLPLDYEAFSEADALLGHGSVVVFGDDADMARLARGAMDFCAIESCGTCTPCRVGSVRGVELLDRIIAGVDRRGDLDLLDDLCDVMAETSLCAMGGLTPLPVRSALRHFPEDFEGRVTT